MPAIRREQPLLAIAFIIVTISTVAWTLANRTPPSWDPSDHMRTAYDFYRPLSQGQFAEFYRELFKVRHAYGPLFHWITAGIFLAAGVSQLTGIAANFLALAVLLFSVNWIAEKLQSPSSQTRSPDSVIRPGVIAALLTVCYHFPAWLVHEAFLDYLLTAMVALAFALLIRAGEFHVRADAIRFGVAAGLGMLAKQTFLFFFLLPAAFLCYRAFHRRDRKALVNLSLSALVAILIASLWYVPHWKDVMDIYRVNAANALVENEATIFSFHFLAYYWGVLFGLQIQLVFAILFIVGAVYSLRRRLRQDSMLYLWILSGILSFTFIANKDPRYTVPILPAVALLSVSWLNDIRIDRRLLAAAMIVVWSLVSFFNAQWPSRNVDFRSSALGLPLYFLSGNVFRFDHRPLDDDWSVPEIVHASSGKLGVVPNIWQLNPSNVALYVRVHAPQVKVVWVSIDNAGKSLEQCDFVLARTHLKTAERVEPLERKVADYLGEHPDRFIPVSTFRLPHFQEAVLYRRSNLVQ